MIQDGTLNRLSRIGTVRIFKAQEYICYEGQPGEEMYIILKGAVGVYASRPDESQIEICRIGKGDFFGEMALIDNQPRSASCIALENVVCAAIGQDKFQQFITACPDLAMKILENLSIRIRGLNDALYKSNAVSSAHRALQFEIPEEYAESHDISEPPYNMSVLDPLTTLCPVCGKKIVVFSMKKLLMTPKDTKENGRSVYNECDPAWHNIWNCPYCQYSNLYSRFFGILPQEKEHVRQILKEQHIPAIQRRPELKSPFDHLFIHYLQAIHINRTANDNLLIGRLWLNLYWLFDDAVDPLMKGYCAKKSASAFSAALSADEIPDEESRLAISGVIENLRKETLAKSVG